MKEIDLLKNTNKYQCQETDHRVCLNCKHYGCAREIKLRTNALPRIPLWIILSCFAIIGLILYGLWHVKDLLK